MTHANVPADHGICADPGVATDLDGSSLEVVVEESIGLGEDVRRVCDRRPLRHPHLTLQPNVLRAVDPIRPRQYVLSLHFQLAGNGEHRPTADLHSRTKSNLPAAQPNHHSILEDAPGTDVKEVARVGLEEDVNAPPYPYVVSHGKV